MHNDSLNHSENAYLNLPFTHTFFCNLIVKRIWHIIYIYYISSNDVHQYHDDTYGIYLYTI